MLTQKAGSDLKTLPWGLLSAATAVGVVIGILIMVGLQSLSPNQPETAQQIRMAQGPTPNWVIQDSKSCQGNISKLDPTEQARLITLFHSADMAKSQVMASYDFNRR
jgi:hypothetical protein